MPKYIVAEYIPATLVWTYMVEADDEETALDQVHNGNVEPTEHDTEDILYEEAMYYVEEIGE